MPAVAVSSWLRSWKHSATTEILRKLWSCDFRQGEIKKSKCIIRMGYQLWTLHRSRVNTGVACTCGIRQGGRKTCRFILYIRWWSIKWVVRKVEKYGVMYWVHHCRPGTVLTWFPSSWSTGSFCNALLSNASDSSEWVAMDLFALTVHQLTEGTILATGGAALCTSLVPTESQDSIRLLYPSNGWGIWAGPLRVKYVYVTKASASDPLRFVCCVTYACTIIMDNRS